MKTTKSFHEVHEDELVSRNVVRFVSCGFVVKHKIQEEALVLRDFVRFVPFCFVVQTT